MVSHRAEYVISNKYINMRSGNDSLIDYKEWYENENIVNK